MSRIAIGLVAFLAVASVASAQVVTAPPADYTIVTHGQATVKRPADRAWLTVSTEVRDAKPADARQKSADAMTGIQNALKAAGLQPDAIRTTGYSMAPEMQAVGGVSQIRGYVVRNEIEVRVDELEKLPQVIDAVNGPKNAGLSVSGPRFDLKNRDAAEQDVLRIAVENALARAQAIATGARHSLGPILHIEDETDMDTPRPMIATATARTGAPETPITPGTISLHAAVTVAVAIR